MKDTLDLQKFYPEEIGITEVTQNEKENPVRWFQVLRYNQYAKNRESNNVSESDFGSYIPVAVYYTIANARFD